MATTLDNLKTMRDINDYCVANKIPSLAQGMIELPPPESLRRLAAETVMEETIHTYRARVGEESFLQAIKQFLQNEYSTSIETNNILATHGVSGGIVSTLALVQESGGTRVGLIEPFYTYHIFQIERLFGKQTPIEYIPLGGSETGFAPNWDLIERALGPKGADNHLDILLVCNPSNPAGKVWLKEEMDRLVTLTKERGTRLLVDECYSDMVWEPHVHYSPIQDELHDHVVVVRGFSKVLGCQSWRVGFAISSSETIAQLMRVQDPIYICVPWLQIPLGKYLLDKDGFSDHKRKISELIRGNWKVLSEALKNKFGWEPLETNGSMYGMLKHNEATDMDAVKLGLASGVGVCPGSMFFANFPAQTGYVRIHCGVSAEKAALIVSNLA